ncbi:hypothetical protein BDY21DRAFT_375676 [Lineolata rhizophorae]|uniref:Uncharacterized protein n=1 Tax=Lineolata rhizophorae TaxID=578093 RepID=A0A6A6NKS8_9PEZI|nr:hypothetical protein BDY21DRAFT_375676 [Lineolata rhizophorae]
MGSSQSHEAGCDDAEPAAPAGPKREAADPPLAGAPPAGHRTATSKKRRLDAQARPAPPADETPSRPGPSQSTSPTAVRPQPASRRKKRLAEHVPLQPAAAPVSSPPSGRLDAGFKSSGAFTRREKDLLQRAFSRFCADNALSAHAANEMIQKAAGGLAEGLWRALYAALPHRHRRAVRRFCRRQFHNCEKRGKWTREEEKELREAYEACPNEWVKIGERIGRRPEDCRDRWRDYVRGQQKRKTDYWSEAEERLFLELVREHLARHARRAMEDRAIDGEGDESEERTGGEKRGPALDYAQLEAALNFTLVSEEMCHQRSRLQCLSKWRKLKSKLGPDFARRLLENPERIPGIAMSARKVPTLRVAESDGSRRFKEAARNFRFMKPGDWLAVLDEVEASGTLSEERIDWRAIAKTHRDSVWGASDRQVAFITMKRWLPEQRDLADTIAAIRKHIHANYGNQTGEKFTGERTAASGRTGSATPGSAGKKGTPRWSAKRKCQRHGAGVATAAPRGSLSEATTGKRSNAAASRVADRGGDEATAESEGQSEGEEDESTAELSEGSEEVRGSTSGRAKSEGGDEGSGAGVEGSRMSDSESLSTSSASGLRADAFDLNSRPSSRSSAAASRPASPSPSPASEESETSAPRPARWVGADDSNDEAESAEESESEAEAETTESERSEDGADGQGSVDVGGGGANEVASSGRHADSRESSSGPSSNSSSSSEYEIPARKPRIIQRWRA